MLRALGGRHARRHHRRRPPHPLDDEPDQRRRSRLPDGSARTYAFPGLGLEPGRRDRHFAGVRPVIDTGKADPRRRSREHVLGYEDGLLTVTGGKLTTYHVMAEAALASLPAAPVRRRRTPARARPRRRRAQLARSRCGPGCSAATVRRRRAGGSARAGELDPIPGSPPGRSCAGRRATRLCSTSTTCSCGAYASGCCCPRCGGPPSRRSPDLSGGARLGRPALGPRRGSVSRAVGPELQHSQWNLMPRPAEGIDPGDYSVESVSPRSWRSRRSCCSR